MMRPAVRRLIGGPSGAITGISGLAGTGGSLLGLPSWMRAGTAGTLAGWFAPTATIPNLARLFDFSSASGTDQLECYAEPGSGRWQFIASSSNTSRAVALINRTPPAAGVTLGFAFSWNIERINGAIGTTLGAGGAYPLPALPPLAQVNLYVGNRADGARPLAATFWGLEFFDFPVTDAVLLALAGRVRPSA